MRKLKARMNRLVPLYAVLPSLFVFLMNPLTYAAAKALTLHRTHLSPALPLDGSLPFLPWFVWFYFGAFAFWLVNYMLTARNGKAYFYDFIAADLLVRLICTLIFILLPTQIRRPEFDVNSLSTWMLDLIYRMDTPVNLFPSVHCFYSWMCFLGVCGKACIPKWYRIFSCLFALAIILSTLFIKQHFAVDALAGVLLTQLVFSIKERLPYTGKLAAFFDGLNERCGLNAELNELNGGKL